MAPFRVRHWQHFYRFSYIIFFTELLKIDVNATRLTVEALSYFFVEAAKKNAVELDFIDSALLVGFQPPAAKHLWSEFQSNVKALRLTLSKISMELPHYHNLEWRLDVQVASRMLRRQLNPTFLVDLQIKNGEGSSGLIYVLYVFADDDCAELEQHLLQTDPATLMHMTQVLEGALNEMKTAYARRIVRNIK